ncbi:MAG: CBS domain-containing protein [Pirellulales bacterium]|nr:CBS domain-containing protein [Pirellulales bacterium]
MKAKVSSIMCASPRSCAPDATLQEAAQLMDQCDCGAIPVVKTDGAKQAVGIITDRDIACRAVARGKGPETQVRECMSSPLATIGADDSVEDCCNQMERFKVRRLLVLDADGELCGIVSQADIALHLSKNKTAEVVREVSQPTEESSLTS